MVKKEQGQDDISTHHQSSGGSSNGAQGAWPPLFSYQNTNIHYCVHAFLREYY